MAVACTIGMTRKLTILISKPGPKKTGLFFHVVPARSATVSAGALYAPGYQFESDRADL